jgi:hypothetical protein
MIKTVLFLFCIFIAVTVTAQNDFLMLKKRHKVVERYYVGSLFTFQNEYGQWLSGVITKINRDSFYFTQYIIHYYMTGPDTTRYSGFIFAVRDIKVLPRTNESVVYRGEQTVVVPGKEKFIWVRNGTLFQILGGGYVTLNVINSLGEGESPFAADNIGKLGIGAGVFLLGTFMHMRFDEYIHLGKKYRLQTSSDMSE